MNISPFPFSGANTIKNLFVTFAIGFVLGAGLLVSHAALSATPDYKNGDLIFHQSQTAQSKAIHEATGSRWSHVGVLFQDGGRWYVLEATQPVSVTKLSSFISRGRGNHYRTYRLPSLTDAQRVLIRNEIEKMIGKNYDIYFEWSDDMIYCSELTYKVFFAATGVEIGTVQKFGDLKLDGPYVKELIRRRLTNTGRHLDLNEPIVTPVSQMEDTDLKLIIKTGP